jgi:flagellum-specific ATP synthase
MHDIVPAAQTASARRLKQTLSTYEQNRDLVAIGAYQRGTDPRIDAAMALWPQLQQFLQQGMHESVSLPASVAKLTALFGDNT